MHTEPGETNPDLANEQAMIDSDAVAMWSNAPIGFEYVWSSSYPLVTNFHPSLNEWDAYISSVSNFMHGQPFN
jgi:hypothetical protein